MPGCCRCVAGICWPAHTGTINTSRGAATDCKLTCTGKGQKTRTKIQGYSNIAFALFRPKYFFTLINS